MGTASGVDILPTLMDDAFEVAADGCAELLGLGDRKMIGKPEQAFEAVDFLARRPEKTVPFGRLRLYCESREHPEDEADRGVQPAHAVRIRRQGDEVHERDEPDADENDRESDEK